MLMAEWRDGSLVMAHWLKALIVLLNLSSVPISHVGQLTVPCKPKGSDRCPPLASVGTACTWHAFK